MSDYKIQKLTLHARIEELKKNPKYSNLANNLMAIKWIGNEGSHSKKDLKRIDLIDAYKILEICLNDIYDPSKKDIQKIVRKVNLKKGSVRK